MKIKWLTAARYDVEEAAAFYDERRAGLGDEFLAILRESLQRIKANPKAFSFLETASPPSVYRRLLTPRFPYVVIFRESGNEVVIVAVAHASRDPTYWRDRE